jgi:hypothetical protein
MVNSKRREEVEAWEVEAWEVNAGTMWLRPAMSAAARNNNEGRHTWMGMPMKVLQHSPTKLNKNCSVAAAREVCRLSRTSKVKC